jgi:hypothetical protein
MSRSAPTHHDFELEALMQLAIMQLAGRFVGISNLRTTLGESAISVRR